MISVIRIFFREYISLFPPFGPFSSYLVVMPLYNSYFHRSIELNWYLMLMIWLLSTNLNASFNMWIFFISENWCPPILLKSQYKWIFIALALSKWPQNHKCLLIFWVWNAENLQKHFTVMLNIFQGKVLSIFVRLHILNSCIIFTKNSIWYI